MPTINESGILYILAHFACDWIVNPQGAPLIQRTPPELRNALSAAITACGTSLVVFLAALAVLSSLGLFLSWPPSRATVLAAGALTAFIAAMLFKEQLKPAAIGIALAVIIVVLSCAICESIYDFSYDGNAYHKQAVYALRGGWNPLIESVATWQEAHDPLGSHCDLWIDHYPQGLWSIATSLYDLTGSIESGKAYTLIMSAGAALLLGSFLCKKGLCAWQSGLIALVAAANPIVICQFATYYNDAFLMMALLALLVGLAQIAEGPSGKMRLGFILTAAAFLLCTEAKFTGFAYAGIFSLSFYLIIALGVARGSLPLRYLGLTSGFFAIIISVSVLAIGFSPYVTNFLSHGHPFYPLFGVGACDIITPNAPTSFPETSNIQKMFLSLFSESMNAHIGNGLEPVLKIPFTYTDDELARLNVCDLRIGGFGVWYSGILLMQIVLIVTLLPGLKRRSPSLFLTTLGYLIPTAALSLLLGESWWARYSAYSYFANCIALALLFSFANHSRGPKLPLSLAIAACYLIALVGNIGFFCEHNTKLVLAENEQAHLEMQHIQQAVDEGKTVHITFSDEPGAAYTLFDEGIDIVFDGPHDPDLPHDGEVNRLQWRQEG